MRLGQTSALYFISKVIGSMLGFLATIYFARVLGAEVLGFYALTLALASWLGIVGNIGFSKAITKRVSEGKSSDAYVVAGFTLMLLLAGIVAAVVLPFRGYVEMYVGRSTTEFVLLLVFIGLFTSTINAVLQGKHLVHVYALLSVSKQGLQALLQVGLVVAGLGLTGMLLGYAVGGLLIGLVGLWYIGLRLVRPTTDHFKSLFDFAKYSWLGSVRSKSFSDLDIAILGVFVGSGLVGVYSVVWSLTMFLKLFSNSISTTLFPEMSQAAAENDPKSVSKLTEDALSFAGLLLVPGLIGGIVLDDILLLIYGEEFVVGTEVLAILILAVLLYAYNKQFVNTLNALDRPDLAFRANSIFITLNIVLNISLIYTLGWVGAAIATAVSAAVGLVFAYEYTIRIINITIPYAEISRQWFAAIVMGVVIYIARQFGEAHWIGTYNEVFVVLLVSLGAGLYFVVLLAISSEFRTMVNRNLPLELPLISG